VSFLSTVDSVYVVRALDSRGRGFESQPFEYGPVQADHSLKVKYPSKIQTFVRFSILSVMGIQPMVGRSAMPHRNLRGGEVRVNIRDQPINSRNLVGNFKDKIHHQIRFLVSVHLSLCLFVS